jgi:hypothetical protein
MRVVIISFVFRMEGLPFTSLVIMVLWDWSLSCWQQALKSMLKIGFGQLRFVLTCLLQHGCTPLYFACHRGHAEVVTVLLAAGAQVDAQAKVWTVEIRVDLSSSVSMDSPPSCLLWRSCGSGDCAPLCWGSK